MGRGRSQGSRDGHEALQAASGSGSDCRESGLPCGEASALPAASPPTLIAALLGPSAGLDGQRRTGLSSYAEAMLRLFLWAIITPTF